MTYGESFTVFYVALVIFTLFAVGFAVTYKPALSMCEIDYVNFCVFSEMVLSMPSWIGSFCGVFVSATLAYRYNLKKQRTDDLKKRWSEEIVSANKTIMLLSRCYGDLGSIKSAYIHHIKGTSGITRGMACPHLVGRKYSTVDFDPTVIYFLLNKGMAEPRSPRNPNYIFNTIERYNATVAMFNTRNQLALELSDKYQNASLNQMNGHSVRLDFGFIQNEIGVSNFLNYLTVTEMLLQQLDKALSDLALLLHELPHIFDEYFKNIKSQEKSFEYQVATFDPFKNPSEDLTQEFDVLDVDVEIDRLTTDMRLESRKHWYPDGWLVTPYSF